MQVNLANDENDKSSAVDKDEVAESINVIIIIITVIINNLIMTMITTTSRVARQNVLEDGDLKPENRPNVDRYCGCSSVSAKDGKTLGLQRYRGMHAGSNQD